jgi:DNA invertase Pin-like site-specific DNA recombinase
VKIAYSYRRFSKLEQITGDSLRRQSKEALKAVQWCNEHGYALSEKEFLDAGKSGYKGENIKEGGALHEFIKLVDSGEIKRGSCLIIDDYSRFSRMQPFDNMELFMRVVKAGIGLAFLGHYDTRPEN